MKKLLFALICCFPLIVSGCENQVIRGDSQECHGACKNDQRNKNLDCEFTNWWKDSHEGWIVCECQSTCRQRSIKVNSPNEETAQKKCPDECKQTDPNCKFDSWWQLDSEIVCECSK
jgi:hypothetical protein